MPRIKGHDGYALEESPVTLCEEASSSFSKLIILTWSHPFVLTEKIMMLELHRRNHGASFDDDLHDGVQNNAYYLHAKKDAIWA